MRMYIAKKCDTAFHLHDTTISTGFLNTASEIIPCFRPCDPSQGSHASFLQNSSIRPGDVIQVQFCTGTGSEANFLSRWRNTRVPVHMVGPYYAASTPAPPPGFCTRIFTPGGHAYQQMIRVQGGIFRDLQERFGDDVKLNVKIDGLRWPEDVHDRGVRVLAKSYPRSSSSNNAQFQTGDMDLIGGVFEDRVTLPTSWLRELANGYQYGLTRCFLRVTIEVTLGRTGVHNAQPSPVPFDNLSIVRKMLDEKIETDAVVVAACGSEIKCHKGFLSAHSPVLATMFQSGFREATTAKIEMVDMSKEGINALLEYLYCWELTHAGESSFIALELFEAGHKYDIGSLETATKSILLAKSHDWYDVTVALRLFLFSRNVEGCNEVKMKAVNVLKTKFQELQACEEYQALFVKDAKAAMELCALAFSA